TFAATVDAQVIALKELRSEHEKEREAEQAVHSKCETDLTTRCDDLAKLLTLETRRCDRLKAQAEKYTDAISGITKLGLDAMDSRKLAQADEGE
ncbi:hypothetical protein LCGC14_2723640, partial [marine sediment metagenome]